MRVKPGDDLDEINSFTLPKHEIMSSSEVAEMIIEHFSEVSKKLPPSSKEAYLRGLSKKLRDVQQECEVASFNKF